MELEVNNKGFTLIELLVGLIIFSILIVAMSIVALSVVQSQRKAFALQNAQESSRFILESIVKEIRTSTVDSPGSGGGQVDRLSITNAKDESVDYMFTWDNKVQRQVNGGGFQDISPDNVVIVGRFIIIQEFFPVHSRVTITMKVNAAGGQVEERAEMYLQNTVSAR